MAASTPQQFDLLTPDELANVLKTSRGWVMDQLRPRNRRSNPLPFFRVGRFARFSRAAVLAWLEKKQRSSGK